MATNGKRAPGRRMSLYAIDVDAEEHGTWEALAAPLDWAEFRLRSHLCDDVQDWMADEGARVQKAKRNVDLTGREQATLFRRAIGEKVIAGWRGLLDDDGKAIEFSRELAREIMADRKWRHFANAIVDVVLAKARLEVEEKDEAGKASALSSDTASS